MNTILDGLTRVLRGALKLVLVLAASLFVLSFLLAAVLVVLVLSLWSLMTGRKPAPVVMFSRMREHSRRYSQGMTQGMGQGRTPGVWPGRARPTGDVVDVEVTEIPERPAQRPG